jgi:hypothetical protein
MKTAAQKFGWYSFFWLIGQNIFGDDEQRFDPEI